MSTTPGGLAGPRSLPARSYQTSCWLPMPPTPPLQYKRTPSSEAVTGAKLFCARDTFSAMGTASPVVLRRAAERLGHQIVLAEKQQMARLPAGSGGGKGGTGRIEEDAPALLAVQRRDVDA